MKKVSVLFFVLFTIVMYSVAQESGKASIYIKRPPMVGAALLHYIELNEIYLGEIKGGHCVRIDVDPGTYVLNYYNGEFKSFEKTKEKLKKNTYFTYAFQLQAGESKYIKVVIQPTKIKCVQDDGEKGFEQINNTINFSTFSQN